MSSSRESLEHAIRVKRKARPGSAEESDAAKPRPFPGRKPPAIPGQLTLGQEVEDEEEAER